MEDSRVFLAEEKLAGESLNIQFLHFHLIRIDLRIRAAVRRWQLAGQDFAEKFRGLFITEKSVHDLLNRPIGGNWGAGVPLPTDEATLLQQLTQQVDSEIERLRQAAARENASLQLDRLASLFGLSAFEFDAFMICLAPMLDTRYERIYGYLQDDVTERFASAGLIFDLLLPPGLDRIRSFDIFKEEGSLRRYALIQPFGDAQQNQRPLIRQNFFVPNEIISWLSGKYQPAANLSPALTYDTQIEPAEANSVYVDLPAGTAGMLQQAPFFMLSGEDELQQRFMAKSIAGLAERPLLYLDLGRLPASQPLDQRLVDVYLRDVKLTGAMPVLLGWDSASDSKTGLDFLFQQLSEHDGAIILFNTGAWPVLRTEKQRIKPVVWLRCDHPASARRLQLWKRSLNGSSGLPERELEILAGQFTLTASQITNAVHTANDLAFQKGVPLCMDDLYAAARSYSSHHLGSLAAKIELRYRWEDIVLPGDEMASLREIANTIRWRSVVLEDWGVGERLMPFSGVSALFAGPPGTGKTLAAQVIAAELKMDLYRVDLSTVVSKYIGETEKNLERIFSQARNSNAILFFDEADSIFGKRSEVKDAHDRYANIEVGYLLQRMENYDGVVILATNLRSNLDEAFTRRIQFIVDFPFPDESERTRIWTVLFPPGVPRAGDIDFAAMGACFRLSGGSIRNVIVGASFLAASDGEPVSSRHLIHAVRREMQKMGRLVNETDLTASIQEGRNGKNTA